MSFSLAIDPETNDVKFDQDGQVVITEDPTSELLLAISVPLGSYHGDPEQGSRIPDLISGPPIPNPEPEIEAAAEDALRRLEETGLVSVQAVDYSPPTGVLSIDSEQLAQPFTMKVE